MINEIFIYDAHQSLKMHENLHNWKNVEKQQVSYIFLF